MKAGRLPDAVLTAHAWRGQGDDWAGQAQGLRWTRFVLKVLHCKKKPVKKL
jgi:hypothetical protein